MRYSKRHNRRLVVETNSKVAESFNDDFGFYFISHDPDLILSSFEHISSFNHLKVHPSELDGRINDYKPVYSLDARGMVDAVSGQIISLDFKKNYSESLLLFHGFGGGLREAKFALFRLSVTPIILLEVQRRLAKIREPYTSIHIRNTDYVTDYKDKIDILSNEIEGPIFVATDNQEVIEYCKKVLGSSRVYNFCNFPTKLGAPLHYSADLNARKANIDVICDLIMLAKAKKFYFFPLNRKNDLGPTYSGFSKLAEMLHKNQRFLHRFMHVKSVGFTHRLAIRCANKRYRLQHLFKNFF